MVTVATQSAMYEGTVTHVRTGATPHRFTYRVAMPLLFLDEIDAVCAAMPWWSAQRHAPVEFRESDFLAGDRSAGGTLESSVRDVVAARGFAVPTGRIALLANLRSFGWQFNPIALYFCFNEAGTAVEAMVAEVTNTPWKQRHCYVVGPPGEHRFDKQLHVSPFMNMDFQYRLDYTEPGDALRLSMANYRDDALSFRATLDLRRRELNASRARAYAMRAMAPKVSLAIYRQALALKMKRVPFVAHPDRAHTKRGTQ